MIISPLPSSPSRGRVSLVNVFFLHLSWGFPLLRRGLGRGCFLWWLIGLTIILVVWGKRGQGAREYVCRRCISQLVVANWTLIRRASNNCSPCIEPNLARSLTLWQVLCKPRAIELVWIAEVQPTLEVRFRAKLQQRKGPFLCLKTSSYLTSKLVIICEICKFLGLAGARGRKIFEIIFVITCITGC